MSIKSISQTTFSAILLFVLALGYLLGIHSDYMKPQPAQAQSPQYTHCYAKSLGYSSKKKIFPLPEGWTPVGGTGTTVTFVRNTFKVQEIENHVILCK